MRTRWELVDRQTFDDMVSVLVLRIYPDAERIDGSGGDEGRDLQLANADGLQIFQLKSFTGRVDTRRRAQIKKSLQRTLASNPAKWTLVVPIDPTPAESAWFKKLAESVSFPVVWCGRTWLDKEMALRPEIERFFLHNAKDEVFDLLKELREENAAIPDAKVAARRLKKLHKRLNEIDPYFRYDMTTSSAPPTTSPPGLVFAASVEGIRVDVYPRYKDALRDRPITVGFQLAFGPKDADVKAEFTRSLEFGTAVSLPEHVVHNIRVDAPGGLGAPIGRGIVELSDAKPLSHEPISLGAEIRDGEQLLASLPFTLSVRTSGTRGAIFHGKDLTGWLEIEFTLDTKERTVQATIKATPVPLLPASLAPVLRWLAACHAPNELCLHSTDGLKVHAPLPELEPAVDEQVIEVVEALGELQRRSGVHFPCPSEFSGAEMQAIVECRALMAGDATHGSWSSLKMKLVLNKDSNIESLGTHETAFRIERDETLQVSGHDIPIGRVRIQLVSARAARPEKIKKAIEERKRRISLELVPGSSAEVIRQRIGSIGSVA